MRSSARWFPLTALIILAAACAGGDSADDAAVGDTLTREQRDSIIGASSLPGASGVRGALEVADSAAARQQRSDSLLRTP